MSSPTNSSIRYRQKLGNPPRCEAIKRDGTQCTILAKDNRNGIRVCGNHAASFDELAYYRGPMFAYERLMRVR